MDDLQKIKSIIESLLIISNNGLSREDLRGAIDQADSKDIEEALDLLKEEYSEPNRGFNIAEIAGKCRIVSKPEYMPWISNLYKKDVDRLTGPSLETLAILAYKQPVTRAEIEAIRGVNLGGMLKTLLDKDLIQVRGRKDVIGRPLLYGTAPKFLEIFGLNSLDDLPSLREFSEEDLEYGKPQDQLPVDENADEAEITDEQPPQTKDDVPEEQEVSEEAESYEGIADNTQQETEVNSKEDDTETENPLDDETDSDESDPQILDDEQAEETVEPLEEEEDQDRKEEVEDKV